MGITFELMKSLMSMMLIALTGFALVKMKLMKSGDGRVLSQLNVSILMPCMLLRCFEIDLTGDRVASFAAGCVFAAVLFVVWIAGLRLLRSVLKLNCVDEASAIYPNCGNLILPLVVMTLGEEYVFYATPFQLVFNLFIWTHGQSLIRGSRGVNWKRILRNPNLIGIGIGLVLFFTGLRIPAVIDNAMASLGNAVGPVSMLIIGMVIADADLKEHLSDRTIWIAEAMRLLVCPLTGMALLLASGITERIPALVPVFLISMMTASAPPANLVAQIAVLHDRYPVRAGIHNVLGTILSVLTMPFVIAVYTALFMK